jgi:hypothetical protein
LLLAGDQQARTELEALAAEEARITPLVENCVRAFEQSTNPVRVSLEERFIEDNSEVVAERLEILRQDVREMIELSS